MRFHEFATAIHNHMGKMLAGGAEAYLVDSSKEDMWATYLEAFPPGTNPMFRQRTEHDCSCCKSFIRGVGNLVTLDNKGEIQTIWDAEISDPTYKVVAAKLAEFVRCGSVSRVYRSREPGYGVESNIEVLAEGGSITWNHFHVKLPSRLVVKDVGAAQAATLAAHQVLSRGLGELTPEIIEIILDLIGSNSLYRGGEHLPAVQGFKRLQEEYAKLAPEQREGFCWSRVNDPAARFRNTVIGTLAVDLAEGTPLERAVAAFEKKVAPENYKRSSAPITQGMIEKALEALRELGLESSLHRRPARRGDVSVNDVLFVDRGVSPLMKDGLKDLLMTAVKPSDKAPKGASEITGEDFFSQVLPGAEGIEVMLAPEHVNNFMMLTAPLEPSSGKLFQWDNDFAWGYAGNLADSSMRRAVQERGGRVDGVFRFTHSWNYDKRNTSLMDLHVFMPGNSTEPFNGAHDFYGNDERIGWGPAKERRKHVRSGGVQDIDYTLPAPAGYVPVENITFPDVGRMPNGRYVCKIHNWQLRSPTEGGFRAEIEIQGRLYQYEYSKPLGHKEWVTVAEVTLQNGVFNIKHHLTPTVRHGSQWGIQTGHRVAVDSVMLSPNHWNGQSKGNKHHFFVLRGCKNPDPMRGFFNEQLRGDLTQHRKTFEVLGSKLLVQPTDDQLAGVGFSSTRKDKATFFVRKDGATRTYNVQF